MEPPPHAPQIKDRLLGGFLNIRLLLRNELIVFFSSGVPLSWEKIAQELSQIEKLNKKITANIIIELKVYYKEPREQAEAFLKLLCELRVSVNTLIDALNAIKNEKLAKEFKDTLESAIEPEDPPEVLLQLAPLMGELPPRLPGIISRPEVEKLISRLLVYSINGQGRGIAVAAAVKGMAGVGKTVLVRESIEDIRLRNRYELIFWITLGSELRSKEQLCQKLENLSIALGEKPDQQFSDISKAITYIQRLLRNKHCLLIIDDVWHPEQAQIIYQLQNHCQLVITTRDADLAGENSIFSLDCLDPDLADQVLLTPLRVDSSQIEKEAKRLNVEPNIRAEVSRRCGYLPLALRIISSLVRIRNASSLPWSDALKLLDSSHNPSVEVFIRRYPNQPTKSIFDSVNASVLLLSDNDKARFTDLAIFPEDTFLPGSVIALLWKMDQLDANTILDNLVSKSLLTKIDDNYTLHDMVREYCKISISADRQVILHKNICDSWLFFIDPLVSKDPLDIRKFLPSMSKVTNIELSKYFFTYLPYHLRLAGLINECNDLQSDFRWYFAALKAIGDLPLEDRFRFNTLTKNTFPFLVNFKLDEHSYLEALNQENSNILLWQTTLNELQLSLANYQSLLISAFHFIFDDRTNALFWRTKPFFKKLGLWKTAKQYFCKFLTAKPSFDLAALHKLLGSLRNPSLSEDEQIAIIIQLRDGVRVGDQIIVDALFSKLIQTQSNIIQKKIAELFRQEAFRTPLREFIVNHLINLQKDNPGIRNLILSTLRSRFLRGNGAVLQLACDILQNRFYDVRDRAVALRLFLEVATEITPEIAYQALVTASTEESLQLTFLRAVPSVSFVNRNILQRQCIGLLLDGSESIRQAAADALVQEQLASEQLDLLISTAERDNGHSKLLMNVLLHVGLHDLRVRLLVLQHATFLDISEEDLFEQLRRRGDDASPSALCAMASHSSPLVRDYLRTAILSTTFGKSLFTRTMLLAAQDNNKQSIILSWLSELRTATVTQILKQLGQNCVQFDFQALDNEGNNALHRALLSTDIDIDQVSWLREAKVSFTIKNRNGYTALEMLLGKLLPLTSRSSQFVLDILKYLVFSLDPLFPQSLYADERKLWELFSLFRDDMHQSHALVSRLTAFFNQNGSKENCAILLLSLDAYPDARDTRGRALIELTSNVKIVAGLLQRGANPNIQDNEGKTPLHITYNIEAAKLLLDRGANPNIQDNEGKTPLHTYKIELAKLLLDRGANPNIQDNEGKTPLHTTSSVEVAKLLLERGAAASILDNNGRTPLHTTPNAQVAMLLLEKGVSITIQDKKRNTPHLNVLKVLLERKHTELADANYAYVKLTLLRMIGSTFTFSNLILCALGRDTAEVTELRLRLGQSLLTSDRHRASAEVTELILTLLQAAIQREKVDLNAIITISREAAQILHHTPMLEFRMHPARGDIKFLPLHLLVQRGAHISIIELLLKAGANPNLKDSENKTALELCYYNDTRQLLKKYS